MKRPLLIILVLFGLVSCNDNRTTKTERAGQPTIYSVTESDAEMNEAMKTSNETLDEFNEALKSANPNHKNFALKIRFNTPKGSEHIWVSNITLRDTRYFGVVANLPESTTEVKMGDTIQIVNDNISDWKYVDNKKLRGGYTIKLLRRRMSEAERQQFDAESGFIVEE